MAVTPDDVLTAVYLRTSTVLRDEPKGDNDFVDFAGHVEDALPGMWATYDALTIAVKKNSNDEEVTALTQELYGKALFMTTGAMLMIGSFPLLSEIDKAMPGDLPENALDDAV